MDLRKRQMSTEHLSAYRLSSPDPNYALEKRQRVKYPTLNSSLSYEDKLWVCLSFLKACQIYSFRHINDPESVPDRSLVTTPISGVKVFESRFINPGSGVKVFESRFINPGSGVKTNESLVKTHKGERYDNKQ